MDCKNRKASLAKCNCSWASCERKGVCCECVAYHRAQDQIPACFFPNDVERAYDRSVKNFVGTVGKKYK